MRDEQESLDPYVQLIVSEARRWVPVDAGARDRLLRQLRAEPAPRRSSRILRALSWAIQPRRVTLAPLTGAALAAGLVGVGVISGLMTNRDGRLSTERAFSPDAAASQLPDSLVGSVVKFELIAPQAARVSLVGDFNGWDAAAHPMKTQGSGGAWTVFVPLSPGLHTYSFVVDGTHFVSDPGAPLAPDDGYGNRSSIVLVGGASS
jgi:hypothetical protein